MPRVSPVRAVASNGGELLTGVYHTYMLNNGEINGLRTWIEIDKKALKHNYNLLRRIIPKKCLLMSVVKSNAYGHSLLDFSKEVEKLGADFLSVDSIIEARALRKEGIKIPILVLGYTMPELFKEATEKNISLTISNFEALNALKKVSEKKELKKSLKIHIKVDTGMSRQGFLADSLPKILGELKVKSGKHAPLFPPGRYTSGLKVQVEGLYTHFAAAKNPSFPKYTYEQMEQFKKWTDAFKKSGFKPIVHAAASSGTLIFPESHFDMVRVGIALYGLWPSPEVEAFCREKFPLKPILTWKTIIGEIKIIKAGSKIGYDLTETLDKDTKIAICPIGYWHGFPRALSSISNVLVKGQKCRVLGKVSMDMIAIDVTKVKSLRIRENVIILGRQGGQEITAKDMANLSDTVNYEIITRINPLVKRFYI